MTRPAERGRIDLTGVRCPGRHGAYPGERDTTRTFVVDLALDGTCEPEDVERAAAAARRAVASRSRKLLERVAEDVAEAILTDLPSVAAVTVRVAKPEPPGLGAAAEAVSLTRARHA